MSTLSFRTAKGGRAVSVHGKAEVGGSLSSGGRDWSLHDRSRGQSLAKSRVRASTSGSVYTYAPM